MNQDFSAFSSDKERRAREARIGALVTEESRVAGRQLIQIGNGWTRAHYDGPFWLSPSPGAPPAISLVFVQGRNGDTAAENPADLGGGEIDLHLIYEGLSRVAADGVLAGATTATGRVFFSVWHPEIVSLRESLGLPRHPAQIVVSRDGRLDFDNTLLFNVPDVPVFILAGDKCRERCRQTLTGRPWTRVIPIQDGDLAMAIRHLGEHGIRRISAVGGRSVASALIDAGVVQDLYLTTTEKPAGQPGTPFYVGQQRLQRDLVVRKRSSAAVEPGIIFEHFGLSLAG